jgi:hypothetical protein
MAVHLQSIASQEGTKEQKAGGPITQEHARRMAIAEVADFLIEISDIMSYCDMKGWERL